MPSDVLKVKVIGLPISVANASEIPRDGDGDGFFTPQGSDKDNMPFHKTVGVVVNILRRMKPSYRKDLSARRKKADEIIREAKGGGFTRDPNLKGDIKTGISIGLNRHGLSKKVSEIFDENGNPTEEAIATVLAWMNYHGSEVFGNPLEGARERGVGGWVEDVDGVPTFFLDVVDIYPTNEENLRKAASLGKAQNQKSVAILDKIWEAKEAELRKEPPDWGAAYIGSGGDGADVIPWEFFKTSLKVFAEPKQISRIFRFGKDGQPNDISIKIFVAE
jgi:hypothetical protein